MSFDFPCDHNFDNDGAMSAMVDHQEKSAAEQAVEMLLYAPVGLASIAKMMLPKLVEVGRTELAAGNLAGQFTAAKLAGRLAIEEARAELARSRGDQDLAGDRWTGGAPGGVVASPRLVRAAPTTGPGAELLAVPDYDSLSASQVLPRLAALDAEELEAVRAYEDQHRGRRTVLARIVQLQSSTS